MKENIEKIQAVLREKYGSLNDCCTNANYLFAWAWKKSGMTVCDCERWRGDVVVRWEDEKCIYDHEWLVIDDEIYDLTEEQYGDAEIDYSAGERQEWQRLSPAEMEEINDCKAILRRSLFNE